MFKEYFDTTTAMILGCGTGKLSAPDLGMLHTTGSLHFRHYLNFAKLY